MKGEHNLQMVNIINIDASILSVDSLLKVWRFISGKRYTKDNVQLLFIDDSEMPVVDNLRKSGYKVTKKVDVRNIHDADVKNAQVIFVDFDGVGNVISSQHQGAGLIKALKEEYKKSKYIVLYSAQRRLPADTVLNEYLSYADGMLKKDADETKFTDQIQKAFETLR